MVKFKWDSELFRSIVGTELEPWLSSLQFEINQWHLSKKNIKQNTIWAQQCNKLPDFDNITYEFGNVVSINADKEISSKQKHYISSILKQFMPWRKGPYRLFDIYIDTEWRSDFKWKRVLPHVSTLKNKRVLDVGCGSGYHLFRMFEQGAKQVIGIDPTNLYFYQFHIIKRYLPYLNIHYVPIGIEKMPNLQAFDTVFSMGVMYHRRDPIQFLSELKALLKKGGELVLETLVIEGDQQQVLIPQNRYAQMRNVWFIPSIDALKVWLDRVGFKDVKVADICVTTQEEQRSTDWMTNHSLKDFLDNHDHSKTIEGYPAPLRATLVAKV